MDWDECAQRAHDEGALAWSGRFNDAKQGDIANWVSSFRNNESCDLFENMCGSFNWSCKVRFNDGLQWLVRFAVPGKIMDGDEKVRREVITMQFIRANTKIPVPSIIAWGRSAENPLGLGAYIIMEFIDGLPLDEIVRQRTEDGYILRSDIDDRELETIFRQVANIYLELSSHDFSNIGAVLDPSDTTVEAWPLTLKINEIESHGGVKVGNYKSRAYSSASEYFLAVAEQDLQHLITQPNSVDDPEDARNKYLYNNIFRTIIPKFVADEYNHGPFKLICDDLRYGNILVNNREELQIVAVLDWEWTYAAPYQMSFSPPRWLLLKRPSNWDEADFSRYKWLLNKFTEILAEEDDKREVKKSMGALMQQSLRDGKFWFHELVYSCFGSPEDIAWSALQEILPNLEGAAIIEDSELQQFAEAKMEQLKQYNIEWAALKERIHRENAEFKAKLQQVIEETGGSEISEII